MTLKPIEVAYEKFTKGDSLTDVEWLDLHSYINGALRVTQQCPTLFGQGIIRELSLTSSYLHSMCKQRKLV